MRVNVDQAKAHMSNLLARVEAGEEVEIVRDGVPVARSKRCSAIPSEARVRQACRAVAAGEAIAAAAELAFSVVSFAEIGVKAAIGKLTVPDDLHAHIARAGLRVVGLTPEHGLAVASLPLHHRDPFDRLLVAQAGLEGFTLVTADARIRAYDVAVLDALA